MGAEPIPSGVGSCFNVECRCKGLSFTLMVSTGCGDDEDDYGEGRYYDEDGNEIDQSEIAIDDFEEVSDEETEEFTKKVKS